MKKRRRVVDSPLIEWPSGEPFPRPSEVVEAALRHPDLPPPWTPVEATVLVPTALEGRVLSWQVLYVAPPAERPARLRRLASRSRR